MSLALRLPLAAAAVLVFAGARPVLRVLATRQALGSGALVATEVPAAAAARGSILAVPLAARYPDGSRVVRLTSGQESGKVVLSRGLAAAGAPDLAPDGSEVLFAGRVADGKRWGIWRVAIDGSGLRPVIERDQDCGDPRWIAHRRIVFVCFDDALGATRRSDLWVASADGRDAQRITFGPGVALDPAPLADGRILFGRGDLAPGGRVSLHTLNPDGTQLQPFVRAAAPGERLRRARPTDDGGVVLVAEQADRAVTTERVDLSDPEGTRRTLVSGPDPGAALTPRPADPAWVVVEAVPVALRTPPRGRPSNVDPRRGSATLICYDSNRGQPAGRPGGKARRVDFEIWDGEPAPLGSVEVASDGSFAVNVPADRLVRLATRNGDGATLANCDWIWVRPGEVRACFGCHERPSLAPVNRPVAALAGDPTELGLPGSAR